MYVASTTRKGVLKEGGDLRNWQDREMGVAAVYAWKFTIPRDCRQALGSRFCGKNNVSGGTSRSRPPAKLQYEPRIHIVHHGYDVCATKYGMLARLVPTETPSSPQNLERAQAVAEVLAVHERVAARLAVGGRVYLARPIPPY